MTSENRFLWDSDDLDFDVRDNPNAAPLISPEDETEARKWLAELTQAEDEFHEEDHPRGQPDNPGQFTSGGGGGSTRSSSAQAHLVSQPDRSKWPAHIKKLRIPPAWTDVKVSLDSKAALQATGRDAKGRAQYVYSLKFKESQAAKKFNRVKKLDGKYDQIVAKNSQAMSSRVKVIREHALVTALILEMGLRPGSDKETGAEEKAFGATTLKAEHVVAKGEETALVFTGKKGVHLDLPVPDPKLAAELRDRAKKGGDLFPEVTDSTLRKYVARFGGFKTKDLRTLKGTREANTLVSSMETPTSKSAYKKAVRAVAEHVSKVLGNTAAVALQSYISPVVFAPWQEALNG